MERKEHIDGIGIFVFSVLFVANGFD